MDESDHTVNGVHHDEPSDPKAEAGWVDERCPGYDDSIDDEFIPHDYSNRWKDALKESLDARDTGSDENLNHLPISPTAFTAFTAFTNKKPLKDEDDEKAIDDTKAISDAKDRDDTDDIGNDLCDFNRRLNVLIDNTLTEHDSLVKAAIKRRDKGEDARDPNINSAKWRIANRMARIAGGYGFNASVLELSVRHACGALGFDFDKYLGYFDIAFEKVMRSIERHRRGERMPVDENGETVKGEIEHSALDEAAIFAYRQNAQMSFAPAISTAYNRLATLAWRLSVNSKGKPFPLSYTDASEAIGMYRDATGKQLQALVAKKILFLEKPSKSRKEANLYRFIGTVTMNNALDDNESIPF